MDVEADFFEIEPEQVDIDLEAADIACNLGVFDAVFDGFKILR